MAGTETLVSLWDGLSQQVVLTCRDGRYDILSTHFVQTNYLVATCRDSRCGRTTSGNFYTIWLRCVNFLPAMSGRPDMVRQAYAICFHTFGTCLDAVPITPRRDNHIMSYLCCAAASSALQNN